VGELVVSSSLRAEAEVLWEHAVQPLGVNRELRPFLRMTFPSECTDLTAAATPGERICRSWLLLGGVVPVEFDDIVIVEIEPGRRFLERSTLLTQKLWEHERTIEPTSPGCRVTDRVRFVPRLPGLGWFFAGVFRAVFRWRHRNLRRLFGGVADQ